jgi:hypothetical protein
MVSEPTSSPQSLDEGRVGFIALLETNMRKKGRHDPLTRVLAGFADLNTFNCEGYRRV